MFRSVVKSAWKVLSSQTLNNNHVPITKVSMLPCLQTTGRWMSYFSRPLTIQPKVKEFLKPAVNPLVNQQQRTVIKYSLRSGKRKSVKAVVKRFYRLDWGAWIRTKCGRHKKLYKKSANRKRRLRQHVFTNATQSWLLDKMVTNYWRKPKYYIDDPYEPYHSREEFTKSRKRPYIPNK